MIKLFVAICALLLAACVKEAPEPQVVTVVPQCTAPQLPVDCTSEDRPWTDMPRRALRKDDLPRNNSQNYEAYLEVTGKRRVCKAAIQQLQKELPNVRN